MRTLLTGASAPGGAFRVCTMPESFKTPTQSHVQEGEPNWAMKSQVEAELA